MQRRNLGAKLSTRVACISWFAESSKFLNLTFQCECLDLHIHRTEGRNLPWHALFWVCSPRSFSVFC